MMMITVPSSKMTSFKNLPKYYHRPLIGVVRPVGRPTGFLFIRLSVGHLFLSRLRSSLIPRDAGRI